MTFTTGLNYINGEWVDGGSDEWITVTDPSDDSEIGKVPDSSSAVVEKAVAAARRAFDEGPWPKMPLAERRVAVLRLAEELEARTETFNDLTRAETGCPARLAGPMQSAGAIGMVRILEQWASVIEEVRTWPINSAPPVGQSEVHREPVGVCAGFVAYNFPLQLTIWKVVPPILMGNTVVVKSSPLTPLVATEFARACEAAGIPAGVVNLVHGDITAGETLVAHPGVDHITFTGSTAVGTQIMSAASATVKRLTLELGGKSPSIVLPDADLELAVRATLFACFMHSGQACTATTRMLLPDSLYAEGVELLRERTEALTVGETTDPATDIGPLISAKQLQKVESMVRRAVEQGAKIVTGGERVDVNGKGFYFQPTVLADVTPDMEIAQEEVFGPVLAVMRYDTVDDAVAIANDSEYGLAGTVFGSMVRARAVAAQLRVGTVWINDYGVLTPEGPFGGYKRSGFGREYGPDGMLEYTQIKHVYTSLDGGDLTIKPYALVGSRWPVAGRG